LGPLKHQPLSEQKLVEIDVAAAHDENTRQLLIASRHHGAVHVFESEMGTIFTTFRLQYHFGSKHDDSGANDNLKQIEEAYNSVMINNWKV
jgi:hypothetical protein